VDGLAPSLVLAHAGACSPREWASTVALLAVAVTAVVRPWRRDNRSRAALTSLVLVGGLAFAGCGSSAPTTKTTSADRPTTAARLRIVRPVANEQTGADVAVELELTGGRVVPQTTGPLRGDEGHIHVSVDGKVVSMSFSNTTEQLHGLAPGPHTLQAEFVAADHVPFRNRVTAAVIFEVKA
jgi:hypothetical protein